MGLNFFRAEKLAVSDGCMKVVWKGRLGSEMIVDASRIHAYMGKHCSMRNAAHRSRGSAIMNQAVCLLRKISTSVRCHTNENVNLSILLRSFFSSFQNVVPFGVHYDASLMFADDEIMAFGCNCGRNFHGDCVAT